jgi:hypothetical protein
MKRILRISNITTLAFCFISIIGFIFVNIFFVRLRSTIIDMGDVECFIKDYSIPVAVSYMVFAFSHLLAMFTLILQLHFFKRDNFLRSFLFFTGIISFLMLFGDWALASDISKEYVFGLPDEFMILFLSQALHFIFYILMVTLLISSRRPAYGEGEEEVLKDDSIFINAQYIGILSGGSGLVLIIIFSLLYSNVFPIPSWAVNAGVIAISLIAVVPYVMIVLYWLIVKIRERTGEWYDEKQYQDISRASLITLVTSIIITAGLFITRLFIDVFNFLSEIWFPFYAFLVLMLFSSCILCFNKRVQD